MRVRYPLQLLLPLILFGLAFGGIANAQAGQPRPPKSQQQLDIAAAKAERKAVVGENMNLTPAQAKVFWPLYDGYERGMDRLEDRHIKEIKTYVADYHDLTDPQANHKLDEVMAIEQARLALKRDYVPKFRAVLPATLVTRFFQIDSKMRAMVQCRIAQMVPLAQPGPQKTSANGF